ncbi:threonine ammonia-lyase [Microvirga puerhi]|uniref:Threonine ammonia-lyase n=1 Tax=Microvirga puerhi TaxID=2876078 RepID=A0ABS7VHK5_9HYPH|nr:threonine ammonia-lyase [Microvirga puerhi]MBZ6074990.1 threonine ammonia-lyase [Microvirga puerhi]
MADFAISIDDIKTAAGIIRGQVLRTPLVPSPRLSQLTGATVCVKHENMQPTGSFKERGAVVKLESLTEAERKRGVIAMSAGNHAQAVAYHARRLGIPATIVMPEGTPLVKAENTRSYGARVILHGETLYESADRARQIAAQEELVFVHPYDDPKVMAGQGTTALEMLEDAPDLDQIVVPIGGGGLISGIAVAAKARKPSIEIVGVEAALYPSFQNAIRHEDRPIGGATLAEGIAVKAVGQLPLPIVKELVSDIILVDEPMIERAVNAYATLQRTMAEGAGAAGLAAMLTQPDRFRGKRVGLVLCGGNIDARILASVMVRELERDERITSFRITSNDRPGLLGKVATRLGELGANILEVSHGRLFLDVPAKGVSIDITIETRDRQHTWEIFEALAADGLAPKRIDSHCLSETAY